MRPLNRSERRKIANQVVKVREESKRKKQYGFGIVVTNLMLVITFWRWSWAIYDRRLS